jgi:hypothetical protein
MLLYAFVGKEKISNSTPHGRQARMTCHSFTATSQLSTIEFFPNSNQRHCISFSWKINNVLSRTHYSAQKKGSQMFGKGGGGVKIVQKQREFIFCCFLNSGRLIRGFGSID